MVNAETPMSFKSVICSCHSFVKDKRCVHAYLYFQKKNKLNLINLTLLKNRNTLGRPKKVKPNTSLNKNVV